MERKKVIDIQKGKDKETVAEFVNHLELHQGCRRQIEQVSMDMFILTKSRFKTRTSKT
ncbi:hypothetical protein FACS1894199_04260 [Bacteroidia bacterium]|nr:hypothetical protein FACS1894199_04260 [Bacteroidia bacterium]